MKESRNNANKNIFTGRMAFTSCPLKGTCVAKRHAEGFRLSFQWHLAKGQRATVSADEVATRFRSFRQHSGTWK
jgi:hypothetical protein